MNRKGSLIKNIVASFGLKGMSILVNVLMMPAYISFFQQDEVLGIWLSILSILTWILNFDMGLGNGLRNSLVKFLTAKDFRTAQSYITSSYIMMSGLAIIFGGIGTYIIKILNWNHILNIPELVVPYSILDSVVLKVFWGLILYFVTKLVGSVLLAMEKTAIEGGIHLCTNVGILIFVLLSPFSDSISALKGISNFYILAMNVPYIIANILIFGWKYKEICPSLKSFDISIGAEIINIGGLFFIIQMMLLVINASNEFVISNIYGPQYVVEYQIYYKLYYCIVTLFSLISNPIWSNIARAFEQEDYQWISVLRKKLRKVVLLGACGIGILTLMFPLVTDLWLGKGYFNYNFSYGIVFSFFSISMLYVLEETSIANGLGLLKTQAVCFSVGAVFKILLIAILKKSSNISWIGVIASNVLIFIPFLYIQKKQLDNFIMRQERNR